MNATQNVHKLNISFKLSRDIILYDHYGEIKFTKKK